MTAPPLQYAGIGMNLHNPDPVANVITPVRGAPAAVDVAVVPAHNWTVVLSEAVIWHMTPMKLIFG